MEKVNFFLAGCQKTGSTWLYHCLKEHPNVYVPSKDALHYFTINYHKGTPWYSKWFKDQAGQAIICDPTPSYIRNRKVPERIKSYNPNSKLLFILRNPIERSFSHYWHQKRKSRITYNFEDPLKYNEVGNYDMYEMWISSSMYSEQLKPYFDSFEENKIKVVLFDDLQLNPHKLIKDVYEFLGVDSSFVPSMVDDKINNAQNTSSNRNNIIVNDRIRSIFKFISKPNLNLRTKNSAPLDEYSKGISSNYMIELAEIFEPEINKLSLMINRDLSHWKL